MADDSQEILGKWTVWVKDWVWEYEFSPGGIVNWRDTRSNEKGAGRWSLSPQLINMSWVGSSTTESWRRPISPVNQEGWYNATYYVGKYKMQKVVARPSSPGSAVDPSLVGVSWDRYVDQYSEMKYDINYKIPPDKSFAFSSILQLTYADGATLELDIEKDFSNAPMSGDQLRDAMARATLGRSGRIFPTVLNERTTPNLWLARADALAKQDEEAKAFMGVALTGTVLVLSMPAMPAGPPGGGGPPSPKPSRRTAPGTTVPPAPIQNNMVRLGPGNAPGSLWASIQQTAKEVIYRVDMIFLQGEGREVLTARATHRAMIQRSAQTAQSAGLKTFKMVGKQANSNFVRHADQLATEIGVPGSGFTTPSGTPNPDYTVTLDVAKALAQ